MSRHIDIDQLAKELRTNMEMNKQPFYVNDFNSEEDLKLLALVAIAERLDELTRTIEDFIARR